MMVDFEQTKREVDGHSVLITSWYDGGAKSWRAGAPGYSHLRSLASSADRGLCSSRKAATDRVVGLLTVHFGGDNKPDTSEHVFFL